MMLLSRMMIVILLSMLCPLSAMYVSSFDDERKELCTVAMVHDWLNLACACAKQENSFKNTPEELQGIIFAQTHPIQDSHLWKDDDPVCVKTVRIPTNIYSFVVANDLMIATTQSDEWQMTAGRYTLYRLDMIEYNQRSIEILEYKEPSYVTKNIELYKYLASPDSQVIALRCNREKNEQDQKKKVWTAGEFSAYPESWYDKRCAHRFNALLTLAKACGNYLDEKKTIEIDRATKTLSFGKNKLPKLASYLGDINQLPSNDDYRFITVHKEKTKRNGINVIESILKIYVPRSKVCMQHYCVLQAFVTAHGVNRGDANERTMAEQAWALFRHPRYQALVREAAERYKCVSWFEAWDALLRKE